MSSESSFPNKSFYGSTHSCSDCTKKDYCYSYNYVKEALGKIPESKRNPGVKPVHIGLFCRNFTRKQQSEEQCICTEDGRE